MFAVQQHFLLEKTGFCFPLSHGYKKFVFVILAPIMQILLLIN
jgi:hypothetical protein